MKNSKFYTIGFIMLTALFTTTSCDSSDDDQETPEPVICPTDLTTTIILNTSTNKAFPLFSEVDAITNANENFTISPLSLSEMLAMASNGANGETRKQINSLIGANEISKENLNEAFNRLNEYLAKVVPLHLLHIPSQSIAPRLYRLKDPPTASLWRHILSTAIRAKR